MTRGVTTQVPHDLIEMASIEQHVRIGSELEFKDRWIQLLNLAELLDERLEIIHYLEAFPVRDVGSTHPQHVVHHPFETVRIFLNNCDQTPDGIIERRFLLEQFCRMADRTQRIANFVRDV